MSDFRTFATGSSDLTARLRDTFADAAAKRLAARLGPNQWTAYRALGDAYARKRETLEADYRSDYDLRVQTKLKNLIDGAANKTRDFKPIWSDVDRFDGKALAARAHRLVQSEHDRACDALRDERLGAIERLTDAAHRRAAGQLNLKRNFRPASDRRVGERRRARD